MESLLRYSASIMDTTSFTYARAALAAVEAYVPGEQPAPDPALIKLNTNENPYPPSPRVRVALESLTPAELLRYPDPTQRALRQAAAEALNLPPEWIVGGNGSDELLAMALRAFVDPGDTVAYPVPTYSLYRTLAQMYQAQVRECPAGLGQGKIDAVLGVDAALTFIATPNAPDGFLVTPDELDRLCRARKNIGVVLADEAYVDFSHGGCLPLLEHHDNLVVTRTFSKSFSLAGLRVGLAMAQPSLMEALWKVKDVYNLNLPAQRLAVAALEDAEHMRRNAAMIVRTREQTGKRLQERGWQIYPSQANFILAEPPEDNAAAIYQGLAQRKIYVRYFSKPPVNRGVRISIGTPEQMDALFAALDGLPSA